VAVTAYESHAVTRRMSFSFYPGARPLDLIDAGVDITVAPLFYSSIKSYRETLTTPSHRHGDGAAHAHERRSQPQPSVLAVASSGRLTAESTRPFRVVVVGDSDFVSNSFYPYMSNNRLALAMVRWLVGEADNAPVAARIPAYQTVALTNRQQDTLLLLLVVALPLLVVGVGVRVWWCRR